MSEIGSFSASISAGATLRANAAARSRRGKASPRAFPLVAELNPVADGYVGEGKLLREHFHAIKTRSSYPKWQKSERENFSASISTCLLPDVGRLYGSSERGSFSASISAGWRGGRGMTGWCRRRGKASPRAFPPATRPLLRHLGKRRRGKASPRAFRLVLLDEFDELVRVGEGKLLRELFGEDLRGILNAGHSRSEKESFSASFSARHFSWSAWSTTSRRRRKASPRALPHQAVGVSRLRRGGRRRKASPRAFPLCHLEDTTH